MALPASGSISFSQISNEFGLPSGRNLGAYRINQSVGTLSNLPLDNGIPQSGDIRFSDFRGKRLNIVVDFHSIENDTTRRDAKNRYDNNGVTVIGGFRSRPGSSSGTKVYINVNRRIGSDKGGRNNVALRTGSWDSDTQLITIIGPSGSLMGAGGDGGNGGSFGATISRYNPNNGQSGTAFAIGNIAAGQGGQGSSALGIQHPTTVINQGVIRAGRGGGGGGGSGSGVDFHDTQDCSNRRTSPLVGGGGGAGGSGLPAGDGGKFGNYLSRLANKSRGSTTMPTSGTSASATVDGQGGSGGVVVPQDFDKCSRKIASSGSGGTAESDGGNGDNAYTSRGLGGNRGYGVIISSSGSLVGGSISGNAADGDTVYV